MRSACLCFPLVVVIAGAASSVVHAAPADDPIEKAVKKAVGYLKGMHQPGPTYRGGSHGTGTAPLVGLALLEAGVPQTDPALKNIISFVRENALAQTATYNVSLTILFLDKLGHPGDRPIIQLLGVRLLAGQEPGGGWSYDCGNALTADEEARLKKVFQNENKLVAKQKAKKDRPDLPADPKKKDTPPAEPKPNDEMPQLHAEVVKWGKLINKMGGGDRFGIGRFGDGDNSNTQFAVLGVWTARKHGLPCDAAIALFEKRFHASQDADGGWGYKADFRRGSTPAMTCAGLLALAVSHGSMENALRNKPDKEAPAKPKGMVEVGDDAAIKAGLKCLGNYITIAKGQPPEGRVNRAKRGKRFKPDELNSNLYFLWSLERVAVLYGLETIGNHDWYVWGADALVDTQMANGSWTTRGFIGANPEVNTAFAILFLSRANIARDLSTALKGKVKDPGVAVLRGGTDLSRILPKQDPYPEKPEPKTTIDSPKPESKASIDSPKPEPKVVVEKPKPEPKVTPSVAANSSALVNALLKVDDAERSALLAKYRDEKGAAYTDALAAAARKWTGESQREAREALAKRLTRMKAATLSNMLKDEDREIRRAAALACGAKAEKACIPDLIEALRDDEDAVVEAAHASLRELTGQNFGPSTTASSAEKLKAVLAWRNWFKSQMR